MTTAGEQLLLDCIRDAKDDLRELFQRQEISFVEKHRKKGRGRKFTWEYAVLQPKALAGWMRLIYSGRQITPLLQSWKRYH